MTLRDEIEGFVTEPERPPGTLPHEELAAINERLGKLKERIASAEAAGYTLPRFHIETLCHLAADMVALLTRRRPDDPREVGRDGLMRRIEERLRPVPVAECPPEWKDGRKVLVWGELYQDGPPDWVLAYHARHGAGFLETGGWFSCESGEEVESVTHVAALPAPPEGDDG